MKVPNAERAIIDAGKLRDYVLSAVHPVGRFKAAFFREMGYSAENLDVFERHLREQVLSQGVTEVQESRYGQKFVVEAPLRGPVGEAVQIVAVWVILQREAVPRFVTAYPRRQR